MKDPSTTSWRETASEAGAHVVRFLPGARNAIQSAIILGCVLVEMKEQTSSSFMAADLFGSRHRMRVPFGHSWMPVYFGKTGLDPLCSSLLR